LRLLSKADLFFKDWSASKAVPDKMLPVHQHLKEVMELEPTLSQMGRWLFDSLTSWDLPIGRFVDELQSSMPHSGHLACASEKNKLPIPLKGGGDLTVSRETTRTPHRAAVSHPRLLDQTLSYPFSWSRVAFWTSSRW
jgi:hypothetical protein